MKLDAHSLAKFILTKLKEVFFNQNDKIDIKLLLNNIYFSH